MTKSNSLAAWLGMLLLGAGALFASPALSQTSSLMPQDPETVAQVQAWNSECLQCHVGDSLHEQGKGLFATPKGADAAMRHSPRFAASNHGGMACKTCHVGAYAKFPHVAPAGTMKAETLPCDECHAQESFRVDKQVAKSVHAKNLGSAFTCSTCHDPHTTASAKKLGGIQEVVAQDNAICMDCHDSDEKFARFGGQLIDGKPRPDIDKIHDWLPNTRRHWESARCIDCHTPQVKASSALAVSHEILDKESARKECSSCHSRDSALRVSLYRHIKETDTREMGFTNAAFLRSSYVVGATRNAYLDLLTLVMVGGTLAGVSVHGLLRFLAARRRKS